MLRRNLMSKILNEYLSKRGNEYSMLGHCINVKNQTLKKIQCYVLSVISVH